MIFSIICVGGYKVRFNYPEFHSNRELVEYICDHKVKWLSDTEQPVSIPVDKIISIRTAGESESEE